MKRSILFLFVFQLSIVSFAQLREVPLAVQDSFAAKYPNADAVEYVDNFVNVQVHFSSNGEKMRALYNNKGQWKETEKEMALEQLPSVVHDGFTKSKYADWKLSGVKMVFRPGGTFYRVKTEKSDLLKKNLLFNEQGRLVEESIAL